MSKDKIPAPEIEDEINRLYSDNSKKRLDLTDKNQATPTLSLTNKDDKDDRTIADIKESSKDLKVSAAKKARNAPGGQTMDPADQAMDFDVSDKKGVSADKALHKHLNSKSDLGED